MYQPQQKPPIQISTADVVRLTDQVLAHLLTVWGAEKQPNGHARINEETRKSLLHSRLLLMAFWRAQLASHQSPK